MVHIGIAYSCYYYVNNLETTDVITAANMVRANTRNYATTGNGVLTQVFWDINAGEITITSINTYLAEAVADYDDNREELMVRIFADTSTNAVGEDNLIDLDEGLAIEDYMDGDRFLVQVAYNGRGYDIVNVLDAEMIAAVEPDRYSYENYVTVGGNQYDYSVAGILDADNNGVYESLNDIETYGSGSLENTYNLYLDQFGYLVGVELVEETNNYVFITGYDLNGSNRTNQTATANAIFLEDGSARMTSIEVNVTATNDNIGTTQWYKQFSADATGDNGTSEYNKWFTYSVNSNDVYTLSPVSHWMNVRYPAASYADGGSVNTYDFRATGNSIGGANAWNHNVWGNDYSTYITVEVDPVCLTSYRGISGVIETYTGVDDVDITILNDADNNLVGETYDASEPDDNTLGNDNFDNSPTGEVDDSSMYIVYDDEDYVIAAIILGDDTRSSKNYAYVLEDTDVEWREGDNTFWRISAIVGGEIQTLTIKSPTRAFSDLQDTIQDQLEETASGMMELTYDEDGYVIDAYAVYDQESDHTKQANGPVYDNNDFGNMMDPDEFDVYDMEWGVGATNTAGTADFERESTGRTLVGKQGDRGIRVDSNQWVYVVWYEQSANDPSSVEMVYRRYNSMDAAINSLGSDVAEAFTGWVSGVLTDRGSAEYLVIKDSTLRTVNDNDGQGNGNGRLRLNSLGIVPTAGGATGSVTVNVTNMSSSGLSSSGATVEIRVTSSDGVQMFYADNVDLNTATGSGGLNSGESKDISFTYNGSQAASGDYTVTVTITDGSGSEWSATQVLHLA